MDISLRPWASPRRADVLLRRWTTPLLPDDLLAVIHPWRGSSRRGVIEAIVPNGQEAASILIRPGRPLSAHRPGQFVSITVPIDGVRHSRCFSLTSAPGAPGGRLEITVQARPADPCGTVSVSRHLVTRARPGDLVELTPPAGDFVLPAPPGGKLLFLTAGSGITPVMGMLRALTQRRTGSPSDVVHLHHATHRHRVLFASELAGLARRSPWLRSDVLLTRDPDGLPVPGSRLTPERIDQLCPDWPERQTYACGPGPLLDFAIAHWTEHGLAAQLHIEQFVATTGIKRAMALPAATANANVGNPSPVTGATRSPSTTAATATFERSGITVPASPGCTLLDIAEAAGIAAPFGCRQGICHTCSTRLLDGRVRDERDGRLHQAGSHVQLCVGTAANDVILDL